MSALKALTLPKKSSESSEPIGGAGVTTGGTAAEGEGELAEGCTEDGGEVAKGVPEIAAGADVSKEATATKGVAEQVDGDGETCDELADVGCISSIAGGMSPYKSDKQSWMSFFAARGPRA